MTICNTFIKQNLKPEGGNCCNQIPRNKRIKLAKEFWSSNKQQCMEDYLTFGKVPFPMKIETTTVSFQKHHGICIQLK